MFFSFTRFFTYTICTTLIFSILSFTTPIVFPVHEAKAASLMPVGIPAQEPTAIANGIKNTISSVANVGTAGATAGLLTKETLDGIAWAIAKQMVSNMTKSMVNWINSGFQGSPAFITDLNGMLLDAIDTVAGEYIKSLGGIGSFICSPFKLDVQVALQINYAQARSGQSSGPTTPMCKLSDIKNNIEGFLNGIGDHGWQDWVSITSSPQNTPYGAYLDAEAKLSAKLVNEAGQQITIANWNDGFLSKTICESIEGKPTAKGQNCKITTPGKVIEEALTFQLSTGPQSLIQADEINEIIGALINQLTLQAMQGLNGLLGLGGNSNYTDYSNFGNSSSTSSYIDAATDQASNIDVTAVRKQMEKSLQIESEFYTLASNTTQTKAVENLALVQAGMAAIDSLLTNSNATYLGIVGNSTYNDATRKVDLAERNNTLPATVISELRGLLSAVHDALSLISDSNPNAANSTFTSLKAQGTAVQADMTKIVNETEQIKTQTGTNITILRHLLFTFDTASSSATATTSANSIRQKVAVDYISLVQSGVLTSEATLNGKKIEWKNAVSSNQTTTPSSATGLLFPAIKEPYVLSTNQLSSGALLTPITYKVPSSDTCHAQYQKIIDSAGSKETEQLYFMGGSESSCKLSNSTPPNSSNTAVPVDPSDLPKAEAAGTSNWIHTHPLYSILGINDGEIPILPGITPHITSKGPSPFDFSSSCFFSGPSFAANTLGIWRFSANPALCAQIKGAGTEHERQNLMATAVRQAAIYEACELAASDTSGKTWPELKQWIMDYVTQTDDLSGLLPKSDPVEPSFEVPALLSTATSPVDCMEKTKHEYGLQVERLTESQFCTLTCPAPAV